MTKMRDSMPIVFAGLAAVFLLMIIFQWGGQGTLFQPNGAAGTLGLVNGYPITQKEYNKILNQVTAQMEQQNKITELSQKQQATAQSRAWDQAISQAIMNQSIARMGITVTNQEIRDVLFYNPAPEIKKQFTDSLGHFHQDAYIQALRDPRNDSIVRGLEAQTRDQIRNMKWQQMMAGTVRVTDTEAFIRYMTDSAKAMVQVIKLMAPQPTPQMEAQVSPADIQAYYNTHKWFYQQPALRRFQFVGFPLVPDARDTALTLETAASLKARLAEAPLATIDTVAKNLALDYTDLPYQPAHIVTMRELNGDTSLLSAKPGDAAVAKINGMITAVRVMQVFDTGRTLFHVRHITIGYPMGAMAPSQQEKDSALAVAQHVLQLADSGGNFVELARLYSADPRTALRGGDLGWVDTGMFPPPFRKPIAQAAASLSPNAATSPNTRHRGRGRHSRAAAKPSLVTTSKTGVVTVGPLESPRGYDLIQVLGTSRKAWAVVGVPLPVKPSHQSLEIKSQSATIFRTQAKKNGFDKAATTGGYHVITNAPPVSRQGTPIFSSNQFVDWCFEASKGDVSPTFKLVGINAIIVAQLTDIIPAGPKPLPEVRQQIAELLAERQAVAALLPKTQQIRAALGTSGDLSTVANTMNDPSLAPITVLMGPAESVNGLPTGEYVVNNWAYSAQPGTISPPLKGQHGYYIAKVVGRNIPSEKDFERVKTTIVREITQEKEQRLLTDWIQNEKQNAKIVDYRFKH